MDTIASFSPSSSIPLLSGAFLIFALRFSSPGKASSSVIFPPDFQGGTGLRRGLQLPVAGQRRRPAPQTQVRTFYFSSLNPQGMSHLYKLSCSPAIPRVSGFNSLPGLGGIMSRADL